LILLSDPSQVVTPPEVAAFMAAMFRNPQPNLHLLDAGAGVGALTAAWVTAVCRIQPKPESIRVTAFEIEPKFGTALRRALAQCRKEATKAGIAFSGKAYTRDFVEYAIEGLREKTATHFTSAILNPPYQKLKAASKTRRQLEIIDAGTTNLYSVFTTLVSRLLYPDGELVAITPRSFCNGPYFKSFRSEFLKSMSLQRIHVFDRRDTTFAAAGVLQENVIFHATKSEKKTAQVVVTSSRHPVEAECVSRTVSLQEIVNPDDPNAVIRIPTDHSSQVVSVRMHTLSQSLYSLGIGVSTGRVVAFRAHQHLRLEPTKSTAPLVYPGHFFEGFVKWPRPGYRKPESLVRNADTDTLFIPSSVYVVTKRFSSKEERRRVVAAVYDPARIRTKIVGFENHLNYFHAIGKGLTMPLAKGLAAFLNTTTVDLYFRQFSGHTQVNAADLRSLPYPSSAELCAIGQEIGNTMPTQTETDALVDRIVFK